MVKVGLSLAERCLKYTQAYGKKSILETKPIKNINAKSLGVCFPDGSISFQTEEAAQNYARNFCMKQGLLSASEQFEVGVLRQNNRVLGVVEGKHLSIDVSNILKKHSDKDNLIFDHYHPDIFGKGKSYPLSIGADSRVLANSNLKSIIAYNSKGQFSRAERLPNLTSRLESQFNCFSSDSLNQHIATEEDLVMRALHRELCPQTYRITSAGKRIELPSTNFKVSDKTKSNIRTAIDNFYKKLRCFKESKDYPQWANKFWEENAEKYGMKYSTNMDFSI